MSDDFDPSAVHVHAVVDGQRSRDRIGPIRFDFGRRGYTWAMEVRK